MKRRRGAKILLAFGGVVAGPLIGEMALRLAGFSFPTFDTPDRERGLALRAGAEGGGGVRANQ